MIAGTLYLVSTPIGNLKDISFRAIEVLQQADLIAAEDTRTSKKLLSEYNITTPLTSYHDFNKKKATPGLVDKLKKGTIIAVITDAGTPGISDPAFYLVREALSQRINVQSIPGASAFLTALIISGLPTDRFVFEGFLPHKKGRSSRLRELATEPRTIILYESPHRIFRTLDDLKQTLGNRRIAIARELTKKFETVVRGMLEEIVEHPDNITPKGEFIVIVEGLTRKIKSKQKKRVTSC